MNEKSDCPEVRPMFSTCDFKIHIRLIKKILHISRKHCRRFRNKSREDPYHRTTEYFHL